jgi:hypothetical protein
MEVCDVVPPNSLLSMPPLWLPMELDRELLKAQDDEWREFYSLLLFDIEWPRPRLIQMSAKSSGYC